MSVRRRSRIARSVMLVLMSLFVLSAVAHAQVTRVTTGSAGEFEVTVQVSNEQCREVQIAQFIFYDARTPIGTQFAIPPATLRTGQAREFTFAFAQRPTRVVIRGTRNGASLEAAASVGPNRYECGTIVLGITGEQDVTAPTETPEHVSPLEHVPELAGIRPGMSPGQVVSQLRGRGFDVEIQGSEDRPKLGDVDDPLIIGALGSGLAVTGYWVSIPGGSLRAAMLHDRPFSSVFLIVVTNAFDIGIAWPPPGGGLGLFLDRPMALAPGTNFGNAPFSGSAALVLVIKVGGPAQPYVLSLSN